MRKKPVERVVQIVFYLMLISMFFLVASILDLTLSNDLDAIIYSVDSDTSLFHFIYKLLLRLI